MPNPTTLARSNPANIAGPAAHVVVAVVPAAIKVPPAKLISTP